jgi:hypothetical protein
LSVFARLVSGVFRTLIFLALVAINIAVINAGISAGVGIAVINIGTALVLLLIFLFLALRTPIAFFGRKQAGSTSFLRSLALSVHQTTMRLSGRLSYIMSD